MPLALYLIVLYSATVLPGDSEVCGTASLLEETTEPHRLVCTAHLFT